MKLNENLFEDYDDIDIDEFYDEDDDSDTRYEVDSYYDDRFRGLEDDLHTDDFEEVKEWVWEKIHNGGYIEVSDRETGKSVRLDPDSYDWESEDAYRVLDDLDKLNPLYESLNESSGMSCDEIENLLSEITNGWKRREGTVQTSYEDEKDCAVKALKKHYKNVEVSDGRRSEKESMSWVISYDRPMK